MNATALSQFLTYAEPTLCLAVLLSIYWRRQLKAFWFIGAFVGFRAFSDILLITVLHVGLSMEAHRSYRLYFYSYWSTYAVEAILGFACIYGLYNLAMKPLPGLQRLGRLMFRWAAGISAMIAIAMALSPHAKGINFAVSLVSQLQQTQSVITLCMLFFVCLAVRPMGLHHRSKIFGVSLGLGVLAANDLVASSWIAQEHHMISLLPVISGFAAICALLIWTSYFALPEPKRRMVMLPTTSPFLRWNQISAVLNDAPGFVALGEVTSDMFAPAEVEMMNRASAKMNSLDRWGASNMIA